MAVWNYLAVNQGLVLVIDGVDGKKGLVYQLGKVTAASHSPSKDMQKAALE
jgi:hypothetical protein